MLGKSEFRMQTITILTYWYAWLRPIHEANVITAATYLRATHITFAYTLSVGTYLLLEGGYYLWRGTIYMYIWWLFYLAVFAIWMS